MKSLENIIKKYSTLKSEDNYNLGGGIAREIDGIGGFESRRHLNAKMDSAKLTLGKTCQLFKKATGEDLEVIKKVLDDAIPCMEWHHAGQLPKSYGGGMKKTYFVKAEEIVEVATNWEFLVQKMKKKEENEKEVYQREARRAEERKKFCAKYGTFLSRVKVEPKYFHRISQEMQGKYGWFNSEGQNYNLTEYYSGWEFKSVKSLKKYKEL